MFTQLPEEHMYIDSHAALNLIKTYFSEET